MFTVAHIFEPAILGLLKKHFRYLHQLVKMCGVIDATVELTKLKNPIIGLQMIQKPISKPWQISLVDPLTFAEFHEFGDMQRIQSNILVPLSF